MMEIYKLFILLAIPAIILMGACKQEEIFDKTAEKNDILYFKSEKYGFSFSYPPEWEEVNRDLPDRWALVDKDKNTILFLVNSPKTGDLLTLGRSQALRDLYNEDKISDLKQDDMKKIFEIVKLESFNNRTWYTYGVKFSEKNVDSLVSGTLCGNNEIMLVMVSNFLSFDDNKEAYTKILNTFKC